MDVCLRGGFAEEVASSHESGPVDYHSGPVPARNRHTKPRSKLSHPLCPSAQELLLRDSAPRLLVRADGRVEGLVGPVLDILAASACLRIDGGQLLGMNRSSQAKLDWLLAEARSRIAALETLFHKEGEERPDLLVSARRTSYSAGEAIVLLLRKTARQRVQLPDLVGLFDLTRAECQVISMLLNGQCVASIAEEQKISDLTVRTHLKRCYQKLDVRTKEQLFAKLLRLMTD